MSGTELAGLIASIVPLLPAAIDGVRDFEELVRMWHQFERLSKRAERRLKRLKLRYNTFRTSLFQDLVESKEEEQLWIKNDRRYEWDSIITILEKRHPRLSWNSLLGLMEDLEISIQKLAERLKLDLELNGGSPGSKWDCLRRIRFCTDIKHREKYFLEGERMMNELDNASDARREDPFPTACRKPNIRDPAMRGVLRRSHTFHSHLAHTDTWRCDCRSSHCIDLVLHDRVPLDGEPHFWVHFSCGTSGEKSRPWSSVRTKARELRRQHLMWKSLDSPKKQSAVPPQRPLTSSKLKSALKPFTRKRSDSVLVTDVDMKLVPEPRVAFHDSSSSSADVSVKPSNASHATDDTLVAPLNKTLELTELMTPEHPCLCQKIASGQSGDPIHSFVDSIDADTLQSDETHSLEIDHATDEMETISLAAALAQGPSIGLDKSHRLLIAYKITSWHLPDHPDSWLNSHWDKAHIMFRTVHGTVDFGQPLFRRRCGTEPRNSDTLLLASFVRLGILLIELCFGVPLHEHPTRKAFPGASDLPQSMVDYAAAKQVADDIEDLLGPGYSKAVKWCLNPTSGMVKDVEKVFCQEVVAPLQQSYEFFSGA